MGGRQGSGSRGAGASWALRGRFEGSALGWGVAWLWVRGQLWALKIWVGGREGRGRARAGVTWVGELWEEDEPIGGSRRLRLAGYWERKNEAGMLQGQGPGASE